MEFDIVRLYKCLQSCYNYGWVKIAQDCRKLSPMTYVSSCDYNEMKKMRSKCRRKTPISRTS
jgi:hypothetical protein